MKNTIPASLCRYITLAIATLFILACHAQPVSASPNTDAAASAPPALIPVCVRVLDMRCGLLDRDGHWAIEPRYKAIYARADGWRVDEGYNEGLRHADGQPWIEPKYDSIGVFHDDRAVARSSGGKYGFIDRNGDWIVDPIYFIANRFSGGLAPVCDWIGGSNSGHSSCHYIDRDGKRAFEGDFEDAGVFSHGMAVVQPIGSNTLTWDGRRIGLIDTSGRPLIDYAPRGTLEVVDANRVLEQGPKRYALLDRKGKTLLEIPKSGFLNDAGAGMLGYEPEDGAGFGLRRVDSTEIVVPADKGYTTRTDFRNGVATVRFAHSDRKGLALIDTQGRVLIGPGTYKYIGSFFNGVGPVSPDGTTWQLADVDGQAITEDRYNRIEPAWKRAEQTARIGDVWVATPFDATDSRVWIDAQGKTLFTREPIDCGIQVLKNTAGDIIWPKDVDTNCAVANGDTPETPENTDPAAQARVEALELERARTNLQQMREWADKIRQHRGKQTQREGSTVSDRVAEAPWQRGPAEIELGHGITLSLAAGFKYLPADYVPALRDLLAGQMNRASIANQRSNFALITDDSMTEIMRIAVADGHQVNEIRQARTAEMMVEQAENAARYLPGMIYVGESISDSDWLRRPRWSEALGQLSWAYSSLKVGMGNNGKPDIAYYGFANSVSFFGHDAVIIQVPTGMGVLGTADATRVAMADADKIAAGLRRTSHPVSGAAPASSTDAPSSNDDTTQTGPQATSEKTSAGEIIVSIIAVCVLVGLGLFASRR